MTTQFDHWRLIRRIDSPLSVINKGSSRLSYFLAGPLFSPSFFRKSQLLLRVGEVTGRKLRHILLQDYPGCLLLALSPSLGSNFRFSSPCRQLGRRVDRKGKGEGEREECSLEIRRWKWTAGINNLSNDAAPVSESIFTSSLIPKRHSQTMVALEARA